MDKQFNNDTYRALYQEWFIDMPQLCGWYQSPLYFALQAIRWADFERLHLVKMPAKYQEIAGCEYGIDAWAIEYFERMGEHIERNIMRAKEGKKPLIYRHAVSSGHGIGKTCIVSIIILYFLVTRPRMKGTLTANSNNQLSKRNMAEIKKWLEVSCYHQLIGMNMSIGNMKIYVNGFQNETFFNVVTADASNSERFQGQHAADSSSIYLLDECSNIDPIIWDVADGGLSDGEGFLLGFGNPTKPKGRFKECFEGKLRSDGSPVWNVQQVSSLDCAITNHEEILESIMYHGEDSDYTRVRWLGKFPKTGFDQFIPTQIVEDAVDRYVAPDNDSLGVIIACDPALSGDDELVIGVRQGSKFDIIFREKRTESHEKIANIIAKEEAFFTRKGVSVRVVIDKAAGGAAIKEFAGNPKNWLLVHFNQAAVSKEYANERAAMYDRIKTWLRDGGSIPKVDSFIKHNKSYKGSSLFEELTELQYFYNERNQLQLERKTEYKKRTQLDPGASDCLAMTFLVPAKSQVHNRARKYFSPKPVLSAFR